MVPRVEMSYGDDVGQLVHNQEQADARYKLITMKSQLLIAAFEQQQHQNTLISKADKGKLECRTLTGSSSSSTSKQCTNLEKRSENHNSRVE